MTDVAIIEAGAKAIWDARRAREGGSITWEEANAGRRKFPNTYYVVECIRQEAADCLAAALCTVVETPPPPAQMVAGEPVAYLVEWFDNGERRRVQLDKKLEPWVSNCDPTVMPLYAASPPDQMVGDNQPRYTTKRMYDEVAKAKAYARCEALEEAATLVDGQSSDAAAAIRDRAKAAMRDLK